MPCAQLPSAHSTLSAGQLGSDGHISRLATQLPVGQRTNVASQTADAKHAEDDWAHCPFWHITHPAAHVTALGQPVASARQLPSAQRKGAGA